jgi:hypothetical protein
MFIAWNPEDGCDEPQEHKDRENEEGVWKPFLNGVVVYPVAVIYVREKELCDYRT